MQLCSTGGFIPILDAVIAAIVFQVERKKKLNLKHLTLHDRFLILDLNGFSLWNDIYIKFRKKKAPVNYDLEF